MNRGDFTVALLFALTLSGCMGGLVQVTPPVTPPGSTKEEIRRLVDLINAHRKRIGCEDLVWLDPIAAVAQHHSDDMVARGFFSHTNPDGLSPFQRLEQAGLRYTRAAENIAAGQQTAEEVIASWLSSAGHRRNIEDCAMRQHGIGFARGMSPGPHGSVTNAWTHNFVVLRP